MDDPKTTITYDTGAISLALFVRKILIAWGRLPNPKKTPVIVAKLASIVIRLNLSYNKDFVRTTSLPNLMVATHASGRYPLNWTYILYNN